MALDFTKPVQTRSGLKVTILATEARGRFSVIGMIHEPTIDSAATWTAEGAFHGDGREAPADLVQVAETVKRYLPVYDDGSAGDLNSGALKKGYATPVDYYISTEENKPQSAKIENSEVGFIHQIGRSFRSIACPMLRTRDLLIEKRTDRRWLVDTVTVTSEIRGVPIILSTSVRLAEPSSILYSIPRNHEG